MKRFLHIVPGIAAALLVLAFYSLGLFSGPERFFEDILFSKKTVRDDVVVVAIDNKSLTAIGQWPWRRSVFADFLRALDAHPPKAVGIDAIFAEPSRHGEADDTQLATALQNLSYPVVLPIEADPLRIQDGIPSADAVVEPRSLFTGPTVMRGHVSLVTDPDGVVRSVPLGLRLSDGSTLPLFSGFVIGSSRPSLSIDRIAYVGPPGSIARVSFIDAVNDAAIRESLASKYIFLGVTATDLHDEQLTPVSHGVPMAGVEIQAQIAHMLLTGDSIVPLSRALVILWIIVAAIIPSLLFILIKSTRRAVIVSIVIGLLYVPAVIVLFEAGTIGNILHVNLAWIFGLAAAFSFRHYVVENDRRMMRHVFSKYVSKDVLEDILRDTTKVKLGGEEREATVFFSDVRGFTTLSEKLTPIQLTQFLNRYLTLMTDIALEHRGVVDKYIGDAIMVFWGAPLANPNHVLDTMTTSLAMVDALHTFNADSAERGDPPIDIGIGFNSGKVIAGNMGSEQRFDYTVMGDTVNLASRLEGQTKTYGVHIIASEYTMALISSEELAKHGIYAREIDRIRVKGKKLPVTIFEIVENNKIEFVKTIAEKFNMVRVAYYKGDWQTAISLAKEILAQGEDGPTKVLFERAEHFMHEAPENWEGVYDMKTK